VSLVLLGLSACINTSLKNNNQVLPTVGNIANEYLVQNTVKFAKANGIFLTDIDKNPSKYTILNGQSAAESKSNVQSIYSKDTAPYYDATKTQPAPPRKFPDQSVALNRYTNQLYPLDKVPYYSPSKPYRAITNGGGEHFKTPAKLGDLDKTLPTQSNIRELKNQLDKLNDYIEGPKYMTHDSKGREVYFKDPKAYYDPTMDDKRQRKVQLQNQIRHLTNELNSNKPTLIIGTKKSSVKIQNFFNTNSEETSEFIGKSYYYPVDRSTLSNNHRTVMQNRSNLRTETNGSNKEQPKKNKTINIYTRKPKALKSDQPINIMMRSQK
jgi:hypothetical protein